MLTDKWCTSSYSTGNGGSCVEMRKPNEDGVEVRDSKDRTGPVLGFGPRAWMGFIGDVKLGAFDRPTA